MQDRILLQYLATLSGSNSAQYYALATTQLQPKQQAALAYLIACNEKQITSTEAQLIELLDLKDEPKNKEYLKRFFYKCTEIIEDFLAFQELKRKDNKLLKSMLLLKKIQRPSEEQLFKRNLEKTAKLLGKEKSVGQLLISVLFGHEAFFHPAADSNLKLSKGTNSILDLEELLKMLEISYEAIRLKYKGIILHNARLTKGEAVSPFLEPFTFLAPPSSPSASSSGHALITIYQHFCAVFFDFKEEKFRAFKQQFFTYVEQGIIEKREQITLFRLLVSLTAHALRNDNKYLADALDNYTFGIQHDLLSVAGILSPEHFFNYIAIACSLGKQNKARHFLAQYQHKLHSSKRQQVSLISKSILLMADTDYEKAYLVLYKRNFRVPNLRIMARSKRLKACYEWELKSPEGIFIEGKEYSINEELRSFRLVLKRLRDKLGDNNERLIANENFRQMTKLLVEAAYKIPNEKIKQQLLKKLNGFKMIAYRKWLEEKIENQQFSF